ncbi:transcriptional regulator [Actinoplanes sp. N902-109]|nr:transcriptional regulator [Actinoplanes sp. N902-109]
MSLTDLPELPVLVGRDRECAVLTRALQRARQGQGSAVFLTGAEGAGKSRLVLEAARSARAAGLTVLLGRTGTTRPAEMLRPVTEALAPLFRAGTGRTAGPHLLAVAEHLRLHSDPAPDAARSSAVALGEAVLRLLTSTGQGCLLALEDLHDADPRTLALVEYLADNLAGYPVVVLSTLRRGPGPAWNLAQALQQRCSGSMLGLQPLDRPAVRRLVAAHLAVDPRAVPDPVTEQLSRASAGNPFLATELLRAMCDSGAVTRTPAGCRVTGDLGVPLPSTVLHWVGEQVHRLGPAGRDLLTTAAVIGPRFPLPVLGRATGVADDVLLSHLRAAVDAALLSAGDDGHDWYAFANPVVGPALLDRLTPADQATTAQKLVRAVRELYPGLPGDWPVFAARLTRLAGDHPGAGQLMLLAGRRALHGGRPVAATALLTEAWQLVATAPDLRLRVDVLHELLFALAETGEAGRGLEHRDSLADLCDPAVPLDRLAAVHVQFARLTAMAGRPAEAAGHLDTARKLLGPAAPDRLTATVDAVAALLVVDPPPHSAQLAQQAVEKAGRAGLPAVACLGWQARGQLARRTGPAGAEFCFTQMRLLAERHHLPLWRMHSAVLLAEQRWLETGDAAGLHELAGPTYRFGAQALHHTVIGLLAWDAVLRADYPAAQRLVDQSADTVRRLGLADAARRLAFVTAVSAAHRGDRTGLETAHAALDDGPDAPFLALTHGMARAVYALLEDDEPGARRELTTAERLDAQRPGPYPLTGRHGLALLLDVLGGAAAEERWERESQGAARLHWNRHFVLLAEAVRRGRQGDAAGAAAVAESVRTHEHAFPLLVHLGLRLVAEAARRDRWGDPVRWLRDAEDFFVRADADASARACRSQLRRCGAVVPHRGRSSRVPAALRSVGVTDREYEVLQLMAEWSDNRGIASKLFISPRTVEKHVASLIAKTEQTNRTALSRYAARLVAQAEPVDGPVAAAEQHRRVGVGPEADPDRGA